MGTIERLRDVVVPLLGPLEVELWDLDYAGGVVRVVVEREGGIDLEAIAEATRTVSRALDEADPIGGHYTLEVSSPGVERTLRTAEHFSRSVGETVRMKATPAFDGPRRITGELVAADADSVVVHVTGGDAEAIVRSETVATTGEDEPTVRLAYDQIERARTVFTWGPADRAAKHNRKAKAS